MNNILASFIPLNAGHTVNTSVGTEWWPGPSDMSRNQRTLFCLHSRWRITLKLSDPCEDGPLPSCYISRIEKDEGWLQTGPRWTRVWESIDLSFMKWSWTSNGGPILCYQISLLLENIKTVSDHTHTFSLRPKHWYTGPESATPFMTFFGSSLKK